MHTAGLWSKVQPEAVKSTLTSKVVCCTDTGCPKTNGEMSFCAFRHHLRVNYTVLGLSSNLHCRGGIQASRTFRSKIVEFSVNLNAQLGGCAYTL